MLEMLITLLGFQLIGEIIVRISNLPVPAPVMGMILLFLFLLFRRGTPHFLAENVPKLMSVLTILFIPAGVGVIQYFDLLEEHFLALFLAVFIGLFITHLFSAWLLKTLLIRKRIKQQKKIKQSPKNKTMA